MQKQILTTPSCPENLVDEQQVAANNRRRVDHRPQNAVVVKDPLADGIQRLARIEVHADHVPVRRLLLELDDNVLRVVAAVGREGFGDDEHGLGECGDAHLGLAGDAVLELHQVLVQGDEERTGAGDDTTVLDGVLDGPQAVADGVVDLGQGERVGSYVKNDVSNKAGTTRSKSENQPLIKIVTLLGLTTSSTKVYFSSPRVCS